MSRSLVGVLAERPRVSSLWGVIAPWRKRRELQVCLAVLSPEGEIESRPGWTLRNALCSRIQRNIAMILLYVAGARFPHLSNELIISKGKVVMGP